MSLFLDEDAIREFWAGLTGGPLNGDLLFALMGVSIFLLSMTLLAIMKDSPD